ncbi:MAG: hypothetical protein B6D64_02425 [Bacteroidetes bacterium 4484_276]|nr:MAG: hypothetical protein B6D64_02425 [Bacteroidetes bacterium 4484_276]
MKQYEAVIRTIEKLGGIATLGQINQEVFKIKECEWKTKTPFASIRRIVQLNENIYKIKPGLYGLLKYKNRLDNLGYIVGETNSKSLEKFLEFNHSYYQGLLLEIGNMKGMSTYIPAQDKNKLFLSKTLNEISTLDKIYEFSYQSIVSRAKTIDVIWFNERKMLSSVFEVEHSTDIQNSLLKFNDLQDFYSQFYIVADKQRQNEFLKKINYAAFKEIKERIKFIDYKFVSNLHTKMSELSMIEQL